MTAASALDDQTTAAIRHALAEAGAGRLSSACRVGEQALAEGGDAVALNAMLGMLRCKAGDFEGALRHLRPAHEAKPDDLAIAINLAAALLQAGHHQEVLTIISSELVDADPSLQLARFRGYAGQLAGEGSIASGAYEKVVAAAPDDWQSWNNLGSARLLNGDFPAAVAAFQRSRDLNPDFHGTWLNLARALARAGRPDEAENILRAAAERFPDNVQPLKQLHDLMRRRGYPPEPMRDVLEQAVERAPEDKDLLLAVAQQRTIADEFDNAEKAFRTVLSSSPRDADAFLGLAHLYEHKRPEALDRLLAEAQAGSLASPAIDLIRALAHRRKKEFAEGLESLAAVPPDFEPWLTNDLRGQFQDRLGDEDAAFAAFTQMNEAQAAVPSEPVARAAQLRTRMRARLSLLTPEWLASWTDVPTSAERPSPVFLVGFPRSGTTLLDTMLMGHGDAAVMEELPALDAVAREVGGFEKIPNLGPEDVQRLRTIYFDVAGRTVDLDRKVLIDKNPLHLSRMPLIRRLFPDARFILSLRHPADVVLSCYFSNFRMTPAMANFLRLDTAAEYYDLMFRMWERGRELMKPEVHTLRYERLVVDPEAELHPIIAALGLDWQDSLLDHQSTAASRGAVPTASYAQITEPIYRSSIGRWERYRKHLEPVLPDLQPWIEKFGYTV